MTVFKGYFKITSCIPPGHYAPCSILKSALETWGNHQNIFRGWGVGVGMFHCARSNLYADGTICWWQPTVFKLLLVPHGVMDISCLRICHNYEPSTCILELCRINMQRGIVGMTVLSPLHNNCHSHCPSWLCKARNLLYTWRPPHTLEAWKTSDWENKGKQRQVAVKLSGWNIFSFHSLEIRWIKYLFQNRNFPQETRGLNPLSTPLLIPVIKKHIPT